MGKRKLNEQTTSDANGDPRCWHGWKLALDTVLRESGGEMPWEVLREQLIRRYSEERPVRESKRSFVGDCALAIIPDEYLNGLDPIVRLPEKKALEKALPPLEGAKGLKRALKQAEPGQLVVVDFGSKSCAPCCTLKLELLQLAMEMPEVKFYTLDVDDHSEVANSHGVFSIPMLLFF
jgi:thiol-disulfide isomerase/thioredoxin